MSIINPWIFYSVPAPLYGVHVLNAAGGTVWPVTGRWRPPTPLSGYQGWVLQHYRDWYRMTADIPPFGMVSVWGQLPAEWLSAGQLADIPWVVPPWGEVWTAVPYSTGHVLAVAEGATLDLYSCPDLACPVLAEPAYRDQVPVTGQWQTAQGKRWWRVEFKQKILWAPAETGSLCMALSVFRTGRWRSCQPVVMFPPPPHALCRVNPQGRFADEFEQQYDRLDPVFGRLTPSALREQWQRQIHSKIATGPQTALTCDVSLAYSVSAPMA